MGLVFNPFTGKLDYNDGADAASQYLKLDVSNGPITGNSLSFDGSSDKTVAVNTAGSTSVNGYKLSMSAGSAAAGATNKTGGNLELKSGSATGNKGSRVQIFTAAPGVSGTATRVPTERMTITEDGFVGIGTTNPFTKLHVNGDIYASNVYNTNTGDQNNVFYGDGSDGTVLFDTVSDNTLFSTYTSNTYTLTRDIYADNLSVYAGVIINTNGFRIFATNQVFNEGTIRNNGGNATGATAGAASAGNFFKASTAGAAGLAAATVGSNGTAPAAPTANTAVGVLGSRGAAANAGVASFVGTNITTAGITYPSATIGGRQIVHSIQAYMAPFLPSSTTALIQLSPSMGGGSGAKSTTGTAATSGAGGGGGGFVFIACPNIYNYTGIIQALGGNGGNAAGTGGNFGGGGGGGGGIIGIVTSSRYALNGTYTAWGGDGGTSVTNGTTGMRPVCLAEATATGTSTFYITPTKIFSKRTLYMVAVLIQQTGGITNSVLSVTHPSITFTKLNDVNFSTIAAPTRNLSLFYGWIDDALNYDILKDTRVKVELSGAVTSCRVTIDEIQNTALNDNQTIAPLGLSATNVANAATTLTTDLGAPPSANSLTYSVFARSAGTAPVAGTGNTLINNQATAPLTVSEASVARQTNTMTHTTAADIAAITVEVLPAATIEKGATGHPGIICAFYC